MVSLVSELNRATEELQRESARLMLEAYPDPNSMEENMAQKLYELIEARADKPNFGTLLSKNSEGKLVLEMKGGGGAVEVFDAKQVREVMPYTVQISGRHYEVAKGLVEKGDLVIRSDGDRVEMVAGIDTKKRDHSGALPEGYRKLLTEKLS